MNHTHAHKWKQADIYIYIYILTQKLFVKNNYLYISNHTTTHTHAQTGKNLNTHIQTYRDKITVSEIRNHSNTYIRTMYQLSKVNEG